jgi:tetratricopeptide (TPR) repeat protein
MSAGFRGRLSTPGAVCATVLGALLLCAATARAQDKPVDPKVAAKEHYAKGTSFYDLGRYDEAIKEFEAAYQLKNDPAFLYNLAQSYRQAGNHERAVHFYKTYLRYVPNAKNRADIEEKIKTEEKLIGSGGGTTSTTPPPPTNTTTPPPPTNTTTPPPPGADTVVTPPPGNPPPGYMPPPGNPPPGYAPTQPAETSSDPGRKFRIAGMATAGVGAVLTVLGIVEWRRAVKASSDIEDAAVAGMSFDPAVEDRGKSAETLQWVFYGLGTLAIAGGAGLWFYGQHVSAAEATTTWRVSLAPTLAPSHTGATLRISF